MGRYLDDTTANNSGAAIGGASGLLTNKIVPKSIIGQVTVPATATACYITGVAAGARSPALSTGVTLGSVALLASSANGHYVFGTRNESGSTSQAIIVDPVGRKVGLSASVASNSPFSANTSGVNLVVADNGFAVSSGSNGSGATTKDGGVNWANDISGLVSSYRAIAIAPADQFAAIDANRCAAILLSRSGLMAWNGVAFESSTAYATATFNNICYVNGFFAALSSSATDKTALYYQASATANNPSNWAKVTVDAATQRTPVEIAYGAGLYALVCSDGSVYTSPTINGTWTLRTSGIASGQGIRFAGGRFLIVGAGVTSTSTDGLTWTSTTLAGCSWSHPGKAVFASRSGHWVLSISGASTVYSASGTAWLPLEASTVGDCMADHPAGLLGASSSSTQFFVVPDASSRLRFQLSSSDDGGSLRVIRASDYSELLVLAGGLTTRAGGSSSVSAFDSLPAGSGMGGSGYFSGLQLGSGSASTGVNGDITSVGGGAAPMLWELSPAMYGIKIPGGNGGGLPSNNPAGGASILAKAQVRGRAVGYGAGAAGNATSVAGGAGEGVARMKVDVVPGEILLFSAGMPMANQAYSQHTEPTRGHIHFEFI